MSRSVVLAGTERCGQCQLPPRWCVCQGPPPVECPLRVDVLVHQREHYRPTSTGRLIQRVVRGARGHVHLRGSLPDRAAIVDPDRELWILHPRGEPLAAIEGLVSRDPSTVQVLLLDGSWNEAGDMLRAVENWGRRVSLPLSGPSRYWLREQKSEGQHSTVEALLCLLESMGLRETEAALRVHFELHVYAALRARGQKGPAAEYLARSPIRDALPEFLERLRERRPNTSSIRPQHPGTAALKVADPSTK